MTPCNLRYCSPKNPNLVLIIQTKPPKVLANESITYNSLRRLLYQAKKVRHLPRLLHSDSHYRTKYMFGGIVQGEASARCFLAKPWIGDDKMLVKKRHCKHWRKNRRGITPTASNHGESQTVCRIGVADFDAAAIPRHAVMATQR